MNPTSDTATQQPDSINWYALKVFHNRIMPIAEELEKEGIETYAPTVTAVTERNGRKIKTVRPAVASLMFVRTGTAGIRRVAEMTRERAMVYGRHTPQGRVPAPIPDREMDIFRLVVSASAEGLEYLGDNPERFCRGDRVRVTAGPLAGAEGHIVRIRGDRRLVVSVRGICAEAAYKCLINEFGVPADRLQIDYKGGVDDMFFDDPRGSRCVIVLPLDRGNN